MKFFEGAAEQELSDLREELSQKCRDAVPIPARLASHRRAEGKGEFECELSAVC